jgi:tRNA-specific 2-thiouridylase
MEMGARYFASGHYARLQVLPDGRLQLLKSRDVNKDQSYVLAGLNQNQLATTLLPLGEFSKPEVRELARKFGLNVAEQPDSQDLCFIGDGDYRGFLARNSSHPSIPGEITNRRGELLGKHAGLSGYTIGQRKGLGIAAGTPLFVLEKDISKNRLVVGEAYELGCKCLIVEKINWISGTEPSSRFRGMVKIRYRAQEQPAMVEYLGKSQVRIEFENKLRDITPGQAAVIYNGDICLGGGIIAEAE